MLTFLIVYIIVILAFGNTFDSTDFKKYYEL